MLIDVVDVASLSSVCPKSNPSTVSRVCYVISLLSVLHGLSHYHSNRCGSAAPRVALPPAVGLANTLRSSAHTAASKLPCMSWPMAHRPLQCIACVGRGSWNGGISDVTSPSLTEHGRNAVSCHAMVWDVSRYNIQAADSCMLSLQQLALTSYSAIPIPSHVHQPLGQRVRERAAQPQRRQV